MSNITPGRKPTLDEVFDYYTREDFLTFLCHILAKTRVVMVIPNKLHWEPDWEHDEIAGNTIDTLSKHIADKITRAYPEMGFDTRPAFYPSFHQSVWHQIDSDNPMSNYKDCIFESDLPTWRESFRDVGAAVTLMEAHHVRYLHKFSGHRSLHIVIPAEIIPHGYRGKGTQKLAQYIAQWSSSAAHHLPKITRMPYSLNEDTGLVCLPIPRGCLSGFRPWMANLHLVKPEISTWFESLSAADAENTNTFIQETETQDAIVNPSYFVTTWDSIAASYKKQLKQISEKYPGVSPWSRLAKNAAMAEDTLLAGIASPDNDARWLTLEAYLLHGAHLSASTIDLLLTENDEYARVTATDVLIQHADDIAPYLVTLMGHFDHYAETSARAAFLLTLSESLRQRVLDALIAETDKSFDTLIISACLAGTIANDWPTAFRILEPLKHANTLSLRHQLHCQALDMIQHMGGWSRAQGASQASKLAALGPEIVDILLLAAGSPDRRLRRDMTSALADLADPRTVEHLVNALGDDYSKVRRKAISALVRIGAPAVDTLIEALGSDQPKIRGYAATCLGQIRDPKAKQALLALLDDEDESIRRRTIRSLKNLITEEDLPRLLEVIQHTPPDHAEELMTTLSELGDTALLAIEELALRTQHPMAAYYLAAHNDSRGLEILIQLLASTDEKLSAAAVELLTELRDPHVVPTIAEYLLTLNHWRVMWYANALGEIGTPEAVDALIAGLDADFTLARRGAVRGLLTVKDPRAIPHLIHALLDEDGKVRSLAGEALIAIGQPSIAPLQAVYQKDSVETKRCRNRVKSLLVKLAEP